MSIILSSKAEPTITITNNYYEVQGKTANEIGKSLYNNSPIIENNNKFHARTNWNVKWNFHWQQSSNSCKITTVKTFVDIQYILPKLTTYSALNPSLKQKWDKYYQALLKHEEGHKNLGIQAAREIEKSILNIKPNNNCDELDKNANNLGKKIIQKYNEKNKIYDQMTNHGIKDGAIFP